MTSPSFSTLCDHFDQGAVNTFLWSAPAGGGVLATVGTSVVSTTASTTFAPISNGEVSFPVSVSLPTLICTSTSSTQVGIQSVSNYDLTGAGVSLEILSFSGSGAMDFSLLATNALQWSIENDSGTYHVNISYPDGTGRFEDTFSSAYRFLRIRESSGTAYFDSSADGVSWTNRYNASDSGYDFTALSMRVRTANSTLIVANLNYVLE